MMIFDTNMKTAKLENHSDCKKSNLAISSALPSHKMPGNPLLHGGMTINTPDDGG